MGLRKTFGRALAALGLVLGLAGLGQAPQGRVHARTGTFRVAMIQTSYSDAATHPYSLDQLRQAAGEMERYFSELSHGHLRVELRVGTATVTRTRDHYFRACAPEGRDPRIPCPPPLFQEAADSASDNGLSFDDVDGIIVLSPWCGRDTAFGAITLTGDVAGTYQHALDYEGACDAPIPGDPRTPPGPSGVWWNVWAHEIGHQLQFADGVMLGGRWNGHPGGYASGYDLMDSGYPNSESLYGLSGAPVMGGEKRIFPGWMSSDKVQTIPAPSAPGTTRVELAPLSMRSTDTTARQGIKIEIAPGLYYLVEARRRIGADNYNVSPGIWDEGVHILYVAEQADPPVVPIDSCVGMPGGCIRDRRDPRMPDCNPAVPARSADDVPAYCWPYPLWQEGQAYSDTANRIQIRVDDYDEVRNTYRVSVGRDVPTGRPDVMITPWRTPPMDTWETKDIWVDSSCNGYEGDVGARGLRYGRRGDPENSVVGNGDNPCANHDNRLYARVRNVGTADAVDVVVSFEANVGVGMSGSAGWGGVGTATARDFPRLARIAPGDWVDVYVPWRPTVDVASRPAIGRFSWHSCVRVVIRGLPGDPVAANQDGEGEQENIDYFEAVYEPALGEYVIPEHVIHLANPYGPNDPPGGARTFLLNIESALPVDWTYTVGDGRTALTLDPDERRMIPVRLNVPPGAPIGETHYLHVAAGTQVLMTNPAIPDSWPGGRDHAAYHVVDGVVFAAQTVRKTTLSLDVRRAEEAVQVSGRIDPSPGVTTLAIDYVDPAGNVTTRLATTDSDGRFADELDVPTPFGWAAQAIWQGTLDLASAYSDRLTAAPPSGVASRTPATAFGHHGVYLDHPLLNGRPHARLLVGHRYQASYNTSPLGVWYEGGTGRWVAYNEDLSNMPDGEQFPFVLEPALGAAVQTAGSGLAHGVRLADPRLTGNPSAVVLAIHQYLGLYNPSPLGVWYDGSSWWAYNEDLAPVTAGESFFYLPAGSAGGRVVHSAANGFGGYGVYLDDVRLNGRPDAVVIAQHAYRGAYDRSAVGVWYDAGAGRWVAYNEARTPLAIGEAIHYVVGP